MASNCYRKSTLTALNTTAQTFVTAGTILSPGGQLEKTGCSLTTSLQGIRILSDGLYTASGAVAFTPSTAGVVAFASMSRALRDLCMRGLGAYFGSPPFYF